MGATGSVLSPQLANQLTEENLIKFDHYHKECEAQNLTPMDLYSLLSSKYNELVALEKAKHGVHHVHHTRTSEADNEDDDADVKEPKEDHHDHHGAPKHRVPVMMSDEEFASHMLQKEQDVLSHEMHLAMDDIKDLHIGDFDNDYISNLVKRVFNVTDKYERFHRPPPRKPRISAVSTPNNELANDTAHNAHATVTHSAEDGATEHHHDDEDPDQLHECHMCSICFDSHASLDVHMEHSDLHRKNLKLREKHFEEAHAEAIRLTGLAKNVMNTLYLSLPAQEEPKPKTQKQRAAAAALAADPEALHHKQVVGRWKKAMDSVLCARLHDKFVRILETRLDMPRGVELIYEGSKYFHRTKTTYDLRYMLHTSSEILEIVPHFVPYNHERSELEDLTVAGAKSVIASKRIYLRYNEVVKAFFGYNIKHTELTDDLELGNAPLTLNEKGSIKRAEITALDIFITNRIKIHKSHGPEDALFFDLHKINHDTLLKELPKNFYPVPVGVDIITNIWIRRCEKASAAASAAVSHSVSTDALDSAALAEEATAIMATANANTAANAAAATLHAAHPPAALAASVGKSPPR